MNETKTNNDFQLTLLFILSLVVYYLLRFGGSYFFENNWALNQTQYLSVTYQIVRLVLSIVLIYLIYKKIDLLASLFDTIRNQIIGATALMILFLIFQFDSFLYGGGNYLINQTAQSQVTVFEWYRFGSDLLTYGIFKIFLLFGIEANTAGYFSWKVFSFAGTALSMIFAWKISALLSEDNRSRLLLFIITFFGPQALIYFGFIGTDTIVLSFIYIFAYNAITLYQERSKTAPWNLILCFLAGLFFNFSLIVLLPSFVFILFEKLFKTKRTIAFVLSIVVFLLSIAAVYYQSSQSFALSRFVLFINGPNYNSGYSLFSLNHIGDVFQLALIFFPQLIMMKFLFFNRMKNLLQDSVLIMLMMLSAGCNLFVVIADFQQGIVLGTPNILVYLAPNALLLGYMLHKYYAQSKIFILSASVAPFFLLSYLPVYTNIETAEQYVSDYMDKNPHYLIEGCTAIQDSYFYKGEITKANDWYVSLPRKSSDFMDLTAAKEYILNKMNSKSVSHLTKLKTKFPFWSEPRYLLAHIYLQQKKLNLTRAETDTCLMLDPFNVNNLKNDYRYYRDKGQFHKATELSKMAFDLYPDDLEIKTDIAIYAYRLGDYITADSIAKEVIIADRTMAYPYAIRGFIFELNKNPNQAITFYQKFIDLAPDEPETRAIKLRLENIQSYGDYE